jgi:hypothetical protein
VPRKDLQKNYKTAPLRSPVPPAGLHARLPDADSNAARPFYLRFFKTAVAALFEKNSARNLIFFLSFFLVAYCKLRKKRYSQYVIYTARLLAFYCSEFLLKTQRTAYYNIQ